MKVHLQVLQLFDKRPAADETLIEQGEDGRTFQNCLPESPPRTCTETERDREGKESKGERGRGERDKGKKEQRERRKWGRVKERERREMERRE